MQLHDRVMYASLRLRGFRSARVRVKGADLHYVRKDGHAHLPTIVFVHGISATLGHWYKVLPHLSQAGYPCLAVDLPDHGKSSRYDGTLSASNLVAAFGEFLEQTVPGPRVLVGNSLGGGLVLKYVHQNPGGAQAVVALSPAGGFEDAAVWAEFQKGIAMKTPEQALAFLKRIYHRPPPYSRLILKGMLQAMNRPGVRDLIDKTTVEEFDVPPFRGDAPPILIVWGRSDRVFSEKNLDWFRRNLPRETTQYEMPSRTGHCPQLDNPRWTARRILKFVNGVLSSAAKAS